jgi:hypothetical protein
MDLQKLLQMGEPDSSAARPAWLQPEMFLAPDFSADACVADLRQYVSALRLGSGGQWLPLARCAPQVHRLNVCAAASQAPLSQLQADLQAFLSTLKSKARRLVVSCSMEACAQQCAMQHTLHTATVYLWLQMVEVINEDYQDYVNLSAKLVNVDGAVLRMRKPLLELKVCMRHVQRNN